MSVVRNAMGFLKNALGQLISMAEIHGVNEAGDQVNKWKINNTGAGLMELKGSIMEQYGATVANRPAANTVPVGAVYMAVNTQEVWQSNGTDWVVI